MKFWLIVRRVILVLTLALVAMKIFVILPQVWDVLRSSDQAEPAGIEWCGVAAARLKELIV